MATRARIRDLLAGIPRFLLLLTRLLRDPKVSGADKGLLAAAIAYTLIPVDLIPDFLPIIGQLDDLFILALAIDRLITNAGAELVLAHWDGPEDVIVDLCGSLEDLARRLPAPVRERLAEGAETR
jgi:uncharacterized membrane protein YkvA (DUF1232 family)